MSYGHHRKLAACCFGPLSSAAPLLEFGPGVQIYPPAPPLNPHPVVEEVQEEGVPEEVVVPGSLKMEEEVEGPEETRRQVGVEEAAEEPNRALCWGEGVEVQLYLVGREEVEERRWALLMAVVEAALLGLWREEVEEDQSCGEVEEVAVLLWMVEAEALQKDNRNLCYSKPTKKTG